MASLLLGAVGTAIGGGAGTTLGVLLGAAGTAAGAYLDQQYVIPAIFGDGGGGITAPRLDDRTVQTGSYGTAINRLAGPQIRTAGNVIWMFPDGQLNEIVTRVEVDKGDDYNTYSYTADIAVSFGKVLGDDGTGAVAIRRLWGNTKLLYSVYDEQLDGTYLSELNLHLGEEGQAVDSHIASIEGADNTPAYPGLVYATLVGLELADFGNQIPTITAEIVAHSSLPVSSLITKCMTELGIPAEDYDVSLVEGCARGIIVEGPKNTSETLDLIRRTYDVQVQKKNGKYHFISTKHLQTIEIPESAFGVSTETDRTFNNLEYDNIRPLDIPQAISVRFKDPALDMQRNAVHYPRSASPGISPRVLDLDLTLSEEEARTRAALELKRAVRESRTYRGTLPPEYIWLTSGMKIKTSFKGVDHEIRLTDVAVGANYVVEIEGVRFSNTGEFTPEAADPGGGETDQGAALTTPDVSLALLDLPPLQDAQTSTPGFYYASSLLGFQDTVSRARGQSTRRYQSSLYEQLTDGSWSLVDRFEARATIGTALEVLGTVSNINVKDTTNTLLIELDYGSLSAVSEAKMLAGSNRAAIGVDGRWEIIGWQDVTSLGNNQYRISSLLRGLQGTEKNVGSHALNDTFVWLNGGSVRFIPRDFSALNDTQKWQIVPLGGSIDLSGGTNLTYGFETVTPFAPVNLTATDDSPSAGDLSVTWEHHSRYQKPPFTTSGPLASGDNPETYEIEVRSTSGGSVIETYEVMNARSWVYTSAQRSTDGTDTGDVWITVTQKNTLVGLGESTQIQAV